MDGIYLLIVFVFVWFFGFYGIRFDLRLQRILSILPFLALLWLSSIKGPHSSYDAFNYWDFFSRVPLIANISFDDYYGFENGFVILCSAIRGFTTDVNMLFFVVSFLSILFFYLNFIRYSEAPLLTILLYVGFAFFTNEMITIRFGLCVSILYLSFMLYYENRKILSFIILLIGYSVHYSALVGILVYIYGLNVHTKKYYFFIILMSIFFGALHPLLLFQNVLNSIDGFGFSRVIYQLNSEDAGSIKRILIYVPLFYYAYNNFELLHDRFKTFGFFCFLFVIGISLLFIFWETSTITRLSNIYLFSICFLIPQFFILSVENKKNTWTLVLLCYLFVYPVYLFCRNVFYNSGGSLVLYW